MPVSRRSFLAAQGLAATATMLPTSLLAAVRAEASTAAAAGPAAAKLDDWASVRAQFRLAPDYLNFSSFFIASHPEPVRRAIEHFRDAIDRNPFLAVEHGMFGPPEENLPLKVRQDIAAYIGGRADDIALTGNTTTGLALIYNGLALAAGDEVLLTTHDHYSHHEAARLACARSGASLRKIELFNDAAKATTDAIVASVRRGIGPRTRVLGITWVHSSSGIRLPVRAISAAVAEINRERGEDRRVLLVVDGVHGLGAVDETIADMGCDFFAAGAHKWIFAPRGTGLVWANAENWARLRPTIPSFTSNAVYQAWIEGKAPGAPTTADAVSPGGFHAFEHQWAMGAAFRMHQEMGRARVAARIRSMNDQCKAELVKIPGLKLHTPLDPSLSAGIAAFEIEGRTPEDVVKALLARKIVASTSPYAVTYVRLAPSLVNTPEEVETAVAAVREIARA